MDRQRRRELGAWYTPPELVDVVVAATLDGWKPPSAGAVTVLDPACGDGRFLTAMGTELRRRGVSCRLVGIDIDPNAVQAARTVLADHDADVVHTDSLADGQIAAATAGRHVDFVVGNPPFLSPLAARNGRIASSSPAGSPYADAATQFVLKAWEALAHGGRLGFVLPQSVLANRDAAVARAAITARGGLRWLWWSPRSVFEASVRTCAVVAECGRAPDAVRRCFGTDFAIAPSGPAPGDDWGFLLADLGGVPPIDDVIAAGIVADHAVTSAGFRDEFYGVAAAVADDAPGPPLVTSGLIDPGRCRWGERPVRVARRRFAAPRVDLDRLPPAVRRWADRQLVPKVLVASQTKVIEAVADRAGEWLPGVPVVSALPRAGDEMDVWRLAAVLTNPITAAAMVRAAAGSGLSAGAVRVSAKGVAQLPWPAGDLDVAGERLRSGDVRACGVAALAAYGLDPASERGRALVAWWYGSWPAAAR